MFGIFRRSSPEVIDHSAPPFGGRLAVFTVLIAASNLALWCTGIRQQALLDAVEHGAGVIEETSKGEIEEDQIRESIRLQRQSFSFWSTLAIIGDLVVEPLSPMLRALMVTVAFSALAALFGRPVSYGIAMAENVAWQAFWVAGSVLTAAMQLLISPSAANSLLILLPPEEYPANIVLLLETLNPLAICGWLAMGWGAWRRQQANWFVAGLIIIVLAMFEASVRSTLLMLMGAAIRLTIMPQ